MAAITPSCGPLTFRDVEKHVERALM